jgi:hypothetical protein
MVKLGKGEKKASHSQFLGSNLNPKSRKSTYIPNPPQIHQIPNFTVHLVYAEVNPRVMKVGFGVDFKDTEKLATTGISVYQESCRFLEHVSTLDSSLRSL